MDNQILGIHHITAIAGDAQRNYDFYTKVLGLRMVKKTVNFDDPKTYHFYYGDGVGSPGSILTFFPWPRVRQGKTGTGMATEIGYSVPEGSLDFWLNRLDEHSVMRGEISEKFGEKFLNFKDPDGLNLELIESKTPDNRKPWETSEVSAEVATKGFHNVTLTLNNANPTAEVLTKIFGYEFQQKENNLHRYSTNAIETAAIVDIREDKNAGQGLNAGGTNHHVAFRVKDEETLMAYRKKVLEAGLNITEKINRDYFFSLYFREPGGVLFEIATDNPGFATDESVEDLGTKLQLPDQYKPFRDQIEKVLPELKN